MLAKCIWNVESCNKAAKKLLNPLRVELH